MIEKKVNPSAAVIAPAIRAPATTRRVRGRLRVLSQAEYVAPLTDDYETFELGLWGRLYLEVRCVPTSTSHGRIHDGATAGRTMSRRSLLKTVGVSMGAAATGGVGLTYGAEAIAFVVLEAAGAVRVAFAEAWLIGCEVGERRHADHPTVERWLSVSRP